MMDRTILFPFKNLMDDNLSIPINNVFNGLFRPSAMFIEPAHYAQFCSIGLLCSLFNAKRLFNAKSIIISVGIVFTTSGIGIFSVFLLWCIFLLFGSNERIGRRIIRIIIGLTLIIAMFLLLYMLSDAFRGAIFRIFNNVGGNSSAIKGRTNNKYLLSGLSTNELAFGMGYENIPVYGSLMTQYYLTGIFELIYCQGIVGTCLFVGCYSYIIIKSYINKQYLPFFALILYIPILIGTSNLGMLVLIEYIPLLYINNNYMIDKKEDSIMKTKVVKRK